MDNRSFIIIHIVEKEGEREILAWLSTGNLILPGHNIPCTYIHCINLSSDNELLRIIQ